jgi:hypothetical protein
MNGTSGFREARSSTPDHHRIGWTRATASIRKRFQHAFKFSARQLIPA